MRCASVRRTFLDGVPGDAAELLVARKASMLRGGGEELLVRYRIPHKLEFWKLG